MEKTLILNRVLSDKAYCPYEISEMVLDVSDDSKIDENLEKLLDLAVEDFKKKNENSRPRLFCHSHDSISDYDTLIRNINYEISLKEDESAKILIYVHGFYNANSHKVYGGWGNEDPYLYCVSSQDRCSFLKAACESGYALCSLNVLGKSFGRKERTFVIENIKARVLGYA